MTSLKPSTSFSFDPVASEKLKSLAQSSNTTEAAVLRSALALYSLVLENTERGQTVKIEKPNGETLEVVVPG